MEGNGTIQITDAKGVIIYSRNILVEKGSNFYTVDEVNVQPGIYYVTISGDNFSTKVIKQHIK